MKTLTKVIVIDEESCDFGKKGLVIGERGGKIRVQIVGFNKNGSTIDRSWHYDASQLKAIE
jgi:hypothetical protein